MRLRQPGTPPPAARPVASCPVPLARLAQDALTRRRHAASQYRVIKAAIEKRFPDAPITFTAEGTKGATGWLEVQVVGGALLHSKKDGMGYVDTEAKMEHMCAARARARPARGARGAARARAACARRAWSGAGAWPCEP